MINSLDCPKCSGNLKTVIYRDIEVDRCERCHGIWFDSLEAETLGKITGSEIIDLGTIEPNGELLEHSNRDIRCPRCQQPMLQMIDIDKYQIWYEKCPICQGIWLDAGEFKQFKRNFQSQNIWNLVRRKLDNLLNFWRK
ncbi:zf-TFIIB domain-containing protein [Myxosarcina sp. GI1(2024)]